MFMMLMAQALAGSKNEARGICIDYTNLKRPQQGSSQSPLPFPCFERLGLRAGSGGGTDLQDGSHDVRGLCAQDPDMF